MKYLIPIILTILLSAIVTAQTCPADQEWNEPFQKCQDRCYTFEKWNGQECVDRCDDGLIWNGQAKQCMTLEEDENFAMPKPKQGFLSGLFGKIFGTQDKEEVKDAAIEQAQTVKESIESVGAVGYVNGDVYVYRDGEMLDVTQSTIFLPGDRVSTDDNGEIVMNTNDGPITLKNNEEHTFAQKNKQGKSLGTKIGDFFFSIFMGK
jgi:hypothetical protein